MDLRFLFCWLPADQTMQKEEKADTGSKTEATASEGEELYQQSCVGCHGKDLEGVSGPNLQEVGGKYDEHKIESIIKKRPRQYAKGACRG
ncbi:Cytochrome c-551 [Bacillus subtilis subsp. subtilis str. BSP1]|nr:Cytochrome c-551 [Bacillus subtilis subsp. subtilis str. BSP1]